MSDKRPWAKIDTGYMMNPKWFQVERYIRDHADSKIDGTCHGTCHTACHEVAIANALRTAREAHLASILYSKQNETDGTFPVRAIKAMTGIITDMEELALTALFEVGLWINRPGGMAEVRDYLQHQPHSSLTAKRREAGKAGAAARWGTTSANSKRDGKSHESANSKTMAKANAEERRGEERYI